MLTRKAQLNHALKFMHEGQYTVPLGIAVQDGNYFGKTGDEKDDKESESPQNLVPLLHAFANDFLRVSYMFGQIKNPILTKMCCPAFQKTSKCNQS
jgi:hypothetical protein